MNLQAALLPSLCVVRNGREDEGQPRVERRVLLLLEIDASGSQSKRSSILLGSAKSDVFQPAKTSAMLPKLGGRGRG